MSAAPQRPTTFSVCLAVAALLSAASYANVGWEIIVLAAFVGLALIALAGPLILVFGIHVVGRLAEQYSRDDRPIFQVSLKQMLAIVFVIALACGSLGLRWRAIATVAALGGDWDTRKVLLSRTPVRDADLEHLRWMGRVDCVWLCNTGIGDEGLRRLTRLPNLRALFIDNTQITDAGLAHLETLPLRWLGLNGTAIGDASIPQLAKLKNLERLDLEGAGLTDAGLSRLAAALPHCQISH